ncbi:flap endonuclease-1 [Candidatus Woesearchaeota archaeon]|nr:MAG: flap endonuclease-1 [Candidatus Woesearchaeota archaeon]
MGTAIGNLIISKPIKIADLKGKTLAVDAFNMLYQFVTTIRQADGTPLKDSKGNITSHLIGLFSRVTKLMEKDLKLVFVFDGEVSELKKKELARRKEAKLKAQLEFDKAESENDIEMMKKYAGRTSKLTPEMVKEAKKLLDALGIPVVQAPSEGEAQASYMAKKGDVYAIISQDYDSLLFEAPYFIKNLTLNGRKKLPNKLSYQTIEPEIISLSENLNNLGLDQDQLIVLAMLVGTDYNIGGIKGIGPKNAIKLIKENNKDFDKLFKEVKWDEFFDFPWTEVYYALKKVPTSDEYNIEWKEPDEKELIKILVDEHDFSIDRVTNFFNSYQKAKKENSQKGLSDFF